MHIVSHFLLSTFFLPSNTHTRTQTRTFTFNLEVPGAALVYADWCKVLEQPGAWKWFILLLFSIKTSWEQSRQA